MGKGTIISGGVSGQYQLQINYDRDGYTSAIASLEDSIADYATKVSDKESEVIILEGELATMLTSGALPDVIAQKRLEINKATSEKNVLVLTKLSFEKKKQYLENSMPADETISAWCADFTEDLSGIVGTVEVPGESQYIQIQPGYNSNATYNQTRDGQLLPTVVATPAQTFYNLAMMPGWQKWKPTFRYGTITSISGNLADVSVVDIRSSQQNIEINQTSTIEGVEIEYMNCGGSAFALGDEVLIKFESQAWDSPKIVGFKDNPRACEGLFLALHLGETGVYASGCFIDLETGTIPDLRTPDTGELLTQPYDLSTYSTHDIASANGLTLVSLTEKGAAPRTESGSNQEIGTHTGPTVTWDGDTRTTTETWDSFATEQTLFYVYDDPTIPNFTYDVGYAMPFLPMKTGQEQQIDVFSGGLIIWYSDIREYTNKIQNEFYDQLRFLSTSEDTDLLVDTINQLPLMMEELVVEIREVTQRSGTDIVPPEYSNTLVSYERNWTVYSLDGTVAEFTENCDSNYAYTTVDISKRESYYTNSEIGLSIYYEDTRFDTENSICGNVDIKKQSVLYTTKDLDTGTHTLNQITEADIYAHFGRTKTDLSNVAFIGTYSR